MYVDITEFLNSLVVEKLKTYLKIFYWKKLSSDRLLWSGEVGCYRELVIGLILRFKQGLNIVKIYDKKHKEKFLRFSWLAVYYQSA